MKQSTDSGQGELSWVQPRRIEAEYQLVRDRKTVASLRWEKALGSLATGEAGDSRWTFKRVGVFRPRVTVRVQGSETDIAVFEPGWSYTGLLRFSDGRSYRWTNVSFWELEWAFTREDGSPLVRFFQRAKGRTGGPVRIEPGAEGLPDLPILLLLGWYLLVHMERDADTAAAVVPASYHPIGP